MSLKLEELVALNKFRLRVQHVLPSERIDDNNYLLHWLKANSFNVEKAERDLLVSRAWVEKYDIKNLIQNYETPEVIQKYLPLGKIGFDKDGHSSVWILRAGDVDIAGFTRSVKKSDVIRHIIWEMEKSLESPKIDNSDQSEIQEPRTIYAVLDMQGFSLKHSITKKGIEYIKDIIQILSENYPGRLKKMVIVNAGKDFHTAFSTFKPIICKETMDKIIIFAQDGWTDVLLRDISSETLPVHWGGSRTDENKDPTCSSIVSLGGRIDKKYYFNQSYQDDLRDGESLILQSGSTVRLEVDIDHPDSLLRWRFATKKHDIGFAVHRKTDERGGSVELIPTSRVEGQSKRGEIRCEQIGTYVLEFDNSYSLFRRKDIKLKVELIHPEDMKVVISNGNGEVNPNRASTASTSSN